MENNTLIKDFKKEINKFNKSIENSMNHISNRKENILKKMDQIEDTEFIKDYLKALEESENELTDIQEYYNEMQEESEVEWNKIIKDQNNISKEDLIIYLKKRAETRIRPEVKKKYLHLIKQLESIETLDILKDFSKFKNPAKFKNFSKVDNQKAYKKFYQILKTIPDYKFPDPNNISAILIKNDISEEDIALFICYFSRSFKTTKNIIDNAVFIDNFIKEVYKENKIVIDNIKNIINDLKNF